MVEEKIEDKGQVPPDEGKNMPPSVDEVPLTEDGKPVTLNKGYQPALPGAGELPKKKGKAPYR